MSIYKGTTLIAGALPNAANQDLSNLSQTGQAVIDGKADADLSNLTSTASTNFDGQWTVSHIEIASSSTSLNNSSGTSLNKTVNVPNDGHIYEIMIRGKVTTGSSSGNYAPLYVTTNILGDTSGYIPVICAARTRSSSYFDAAGTIIVPISYATNNFSIKRDSSYNGTCEIRMIAYRRVGTNS